MKAQTTLPHGRYAGEPLATVPRHHLQWMLAMNVGDAELRDEIENAIGGQQ